MRTRTKNSQWTPMARYRVVEAVACPELDGSGTHIHLRLASATDAPVVGWRATVFLPVSKHPAAQSRVAQDLRRLGVTWNDITAMEEQAFVGREFDGEACGDDWVAIRAEAPQLLASA